MDKREMPTSFRVLRVVLAVSLLALVSACAAPTPTPPPAAAPKPAPTTAAAPKPAAQAALKPAPTAAVAVKPAAPPATPAATSADSRKRATDELYQAAKAEGSVVWAVSATVAEWKPVADAFQSAYPGVKVEMFSFSSPQLGTRIITEAAAKKISMDIALTALDSILSLLDRDLLVRYDATRTSDVEPDRVMVDGRFVALFDLPGAFVYNTKLVQKNDVPRTYEDLLDGKWKGRKIVVQSNGGWALPLFRTWKQDKQKAIDIFQRLGKQELFYASRGAEVGPRIATGEAPLGFLLLTLMPRLLADGAPIALTPISPSVNSPFGVTIPKDGPNPNAGKLLLSWLASQEGKAVILKAGRGLSTPDQETPVGKLLKDAGVEYIRVASGADVRILEEMQKVALDTSGFIPK